MNPDLVKPIPVTLSNKAVEEIKSILSSKNIPSNYGLRIGTSGGGCSGVSYIIGFDTSKEKDHIYNIKGITVFIEKGQALFLWGVEVDFVESASERGFVFHKS
jgi:iron-sulfur cluster assembly protein